MFSTPDLTLVSHTRCLSHYHARRMMLRTRTTSTSNAMASACPAPPSRQPSRSLVKYQVAPLPSHFEDQNAISESYASTAIVSAALCKGSVFKGNNLQLTMPSTASSGIVSMFENSQSESMVKRTSAVTAYNGTHGELACPANTRLLAEAVAISRAARDRSKNVASREDVVDAVQSVLALSMALSG